MNEKELMGAFSKSGIIGKVILGFIIFASLFLSVFVWNTIQNNKAVTEMIRQNDNIETLIQEQAKVEVLKRCIKTEYDKAMDYYSDELIQTFGKILNQNNIPFPQELNIILQECRKKLNEINDCLIFPEDAH